MEYPRVPKAEGAAARDSSSAPSPELRTSSLPATPTTDGLSTTDGLAAPLSGEPTVGANIIAFDGMNHGPAVIRYNVALPGRHTGRRIVRLDLVDLGLAASDFKSQVLSTVPESIKALDWKKPDSSPTWTYNADKALDLFFERMADAGVGVWPVLEEKIRNEPRKPDGTLAVPRLVVDVGDEGDANVSLAAAFTGIYLDYYSKYVDGLLIGELRLPIKNWNGNAFSLSIATTKAEEALGGTTKDAHLLLVETYGIRSFLGDYGLGRTVRTFSLLPGEETKISVKTWRSTSQKVAEASSIVDSIDQKAVDRFTNTVQRETTDKANRMSKESWKLEAEVKANWGWGSAKVSGGAQGEYQSSREQFAKQVNNAVQEHTGEASSARDTTVTSSTEITETTGEETLTERTIRNVNLRRVLNFVFRELNQEYTIGQDKDDPRGVQGVVLKEDTITMRTDSFVIEALLGQADALDSYAMVSQQAEVEAKWLANRREELALKTLGKITDPKERAAAYAEMFNPPSRPE